MTDQQLKKCLARLGKELAKFNDNEEKKIEYIILRPDLNEMLRWYFIIKGLDKPYTGGVYMGQIDFPKDYPFSAPVFRFLTPNGRFEAGTTICTSFSHFHNDDSWSANWTAEKMVAGLMSMMFESAEHGANDSGIGGIVSTDEYKLELAKNSMEFNKKNKKFNETFSDIIENLEKESAINLSKEIEKLNQEHQVVDE